MSFKERVGASAWAGEIAFTIEERTAERVVGRMPVTAAMLNPFGTVHAGAMIWFADVVATQCAVGDFDALDESGRGFPLAVDLHTVLLANHGGDLNGFFLIRGDRAQLDAVVNSDEWLTHQTRGGYHLEGSGTVRGVINEGVMEWMNRWTQLISA